MRLNINSVAAWARLAAAADGAIAAGGGGRGPAHRAPWPPWSPAARAMSSTVSQEPSHIRNVAIIAHVDHGKTTLMDRLLQCCGASLAGDRVMDSNQFERERGITISSKYTSFPFEGRTFNVVDTPGRADFGGEVERVLSMVDGAVLLVDATEGPLSQTKFVVGKALARGLRPLVVLNKVDRPAATPQRCGEVESAVFDAFAALGATDEQLDFPVLYASAREGWASASLPAAGAAGDAARGEGMAPLLRALAAHVPPPAGLPTDPFAMLVVMTERDPFVGRIATGRIAAGSVAVGDRVRVLGHEGGAADGGRVTRIFKKVGTGSAELARASAGDVVSIAGAGGAGVADTVAAPEVTQALDPGKVDPPTLSMVFSPNTSPLAGREGSQLTGPRIGERLAAEAEINPSLRVAPVGGSGGESFEVQARGELQLGLLIGEGEGRGGGGGGSSRGAGGQAPAIHAPGIRPCGAQKKRAAALRRQAPRSPPSAHHLTAPPPPAPAPPPLPRPTQKTCGARGLS
jgi:GTP-binding protein